jgi:di/tricarboxylate transporter
LLLLGHVSGLGRLATNPNLIVLAQQAFLTPQPGKVLITLGLLLGIIASSVTGWLSPAISIPLAALAVILFNCIKLRDLYEVVDWQAVVTAAGLIPFGLAVEKTGAAQDLARTAVLALQDFGPMPLLGGLLLVAMLLTHFIDNSAVGIILAPIAYHVARQMDVDPKPFMVGMAICISASFCTPIAHESTILVMGPGRYQFKHYLKVGGALAFLTWLVATWLTPHVWPF